MSPLLDGLSDIDKDIISNKNNKKKKKRRASNSKSVSDSSDLSSSDESKIQKPIKIEMNHESNLDTIENTNEFNNIGSTLG